MTETNSNLEPNTQEETNQKDDSTQEKSLEEQLNEMTNIAKRAMADLQNFKTQMAKEKQEYAKFARVQVLDSFLPILDNLNLALKQTPEELKEHNFIKGINQIQKQLVKITENFGLTPISHETLNPHHHEIISSIPGEQDKIIEVIEQGYMLEDRVLKPSKVVVGNGN
ncbi:nucleotide exchange factor GrpE [bacterium]|jgi:molecular chaperone GrpE|nr:nucleotide exchange factor GrpE [bacterium]MBT6293306.1 nucleotide exchange factor GrpE [bacterium]